MPRCRSTVILMLSLATIVASAPTFSPVARAQHADQATRGVSEFSVFNR